MTVHLAFIPSTAEESKGQAGRSYPLFPAQSLGLVDAAWGWDCQWAQLQWVVYALQGHLEIISEALLGQSTGSGNHSQDTSEATLQNVCEFI